MRSRLESWLLGNSLRQKLWRLAGMAFAALVLFLLWPSRPYGDLSLLQLLELYREQIDGPGLTVREAAGKLETAEAARRFVVERIVYSPYEGPRQTPGQVLETRIANSIDKARLLGALLERQGWKISYVRAEMPKRPPPAAVSILAQGPREILKEIALRTGYDLDRLAVEWQESSRRAEAVRKRVAGTVELATDVLKRKTGFSVEYGQLTGTRPHDGRILIIGERNGRKLRFDPLYDGMKWPGTVQPYIMPPPGRTVVELRLVDRTGLEQSLLSWSGEMGLRPVEFRFLPTVNTVERLAGPADPTDIRLWTPFLVHGGRAVTGKPFSLAGEAPGLSEKPPSISPGRFSVAKSTDARSLRIADIDVAHWPRVGISLDVRASADATWLPSHFRISDNGVRQRLRLINIDQRRRPILIVSDVSPSMKDIGAFEFSKTAIIRLARQLAPETPVGLISFAMRPIVEAPVAPLGNGAAIVAAARRLRLRPFTGIFWALREAAKQKGMDGGVVVLLSDGENNINYSNEDEVVTALRARHMKVVALALGRAADAPLLKRLAERTGGVFLLIRTADGLEPAYRRLGGILSSYVTFEYDYVSAGNERSSRRHRVEVSLAGSALKAEGYYVPGTEVRATERPRLILNLTHVQNGRPVSTSRELVDLSAPDASWSLAGTYMLIADLGDLPPERLLSAYLGRWIRILRRQEKTAGKGAVDGMKGTDGPPLEMMQLVNGFRALSAFQDGERTITPPAGPNHYLLRRTPVTGKDGLQLATVFDVLTRSGRTNVFGNYWRAGQVTRMELASAIAEGVVLGGRNGVEEMLRRPQEIRVFRHGMPLPPWLAPGLVRAVRKPLGNDDRILVSPSVTDWAWQVDTGLRRRIRIYYGDGALFAKGASVEEIAREFEKIDKLYQIYTGIAGNLPGPYATTGAMLAAIATLKRAENRLWCFSTVMMGYVGEAIGSDDALLNRAPGAARANAARLCNFNGGGGDPAGDLGGLIRDAAREGVKSWAVNAAKDAVGGWPAAAHSLWGIGGALYDLAHIDADVASQSANPMTPGFHAALAKTVFERETRR